MGGGEAGTYLLKGTDLRSTVLGRRKQIAEQYAYFLLRGINNMKHFSMGTYMYECIFKHLKEYIPNVCSGLKSIRRQDWRLLLFL